MKSLTMIRTGVAALAAVVLFAVSVSVSAQGDKVDLTGTWMFDVQTDGGAGQPTVTLKQDGMKLTGHYSSQTFGEQELTGSVEGQDVTININADMQGTALTVVYKGMIESKDSMKGTVDLGGLGGGSWTAKRQ